MARQECEDYSITDSSERVVGTWFGKPKYQKAVEITSLQQQHVIFSLPNTTRDNIISVLGFINEKNGNGITLGYGYGGHKGHGIFYNSSTNELRIAMDETSRPLLEGQKARFVCEYTKTTD